MIDGNNGTPAVSVIMPAYNAARTLPFAVESVLCQSLSDFELIIVDDASSDLTVEIIRHYLLIDHRVKCVRNAKNSRQGPVEWEPRNDGLALATAPVIAYLDADNVWSPRFLETMNGVLAKNSRLQLAHCDSRNHYSAAEKTAVVARDKRQLVMEGGDWTVFSHAGLEVSQLGVSQYIDTNEIVHRTSVFRRLNSLWNTAHPRRVEINAGQSNSRPDRRHNDLDLVERILKEFGVGSVYHHAGVLVDFYYPSCPREQHPLLAQLRMGGRA